MVPARDSPSPAAPTPSPLSLEGLGLEEEQFPTWAREDSEGLLARALGALARDADAEVVHALAPAWVARRRPRELPLPDVRDYIQLRAQPSPAMQAVAAAAAAERAAGEGEGAGVEGGASLASRFADADGNAAGDGGDDALQAISAAAAAARDNAPEAGEDEVS